MNEINLDNQPAKVNPSLEQDTDVMRYFNRDLSWLSFNYRVLLEAKDKTLPLYERLKFMAIYSSNLDEFFRVRVASLQSVERIKEKKLKKLGLEPDTVLKAIYDTVTRQQEKFGEIFRNEILPDLETHGINLLRTPPVDTHQLEFLRDIFFEQILPFLHVELLMKNKILHFLRDQVLYLVVKLRRSKSNKDLSQSVTSSKAKYALIQIPTHYFSRFVQLPQVDGKYYIMFLDDVIRFNLDILFPGYMVEASHSIKLSRNADLLIEDEFGGDVVSKIKKSLLKRRVGAPARLLYDKTMPKEMIKYLLATFSLKSIGNLPENFVKTFRLEKSEMIAGGRYHNFNDFFSFPNPLSPELEPPKFKQLNYAPFDEETSVFQAIKEQDHLLHFPYQSYEYVLRFLSEAALDPHVEEIHTTQYRVASDSAIVNTLINAARNNKTVTVFVEIKARFDEATNLETAEEMKQAGVRVIFSTNLDLKVHAKVALVMRKEQEDTKCYAFLSTGNFNEKTASIYADHGLFTSDEKITGELKQVFQFLEHDVEPAPFQHLLVARFNLRKQFEALIDREIEHVRQGKRGHIFVKINNFEDKQMIEKIYEASQAGVKVNLIVRSICCIRPGVKGLSENVSITRIVGRFLEHARAFVFYNEGKYDMYLGSSDWMERNLNRRIEVVFPLNNKKLKAEILHILELQLTDNTKAVTLDQNINNIPVPHDESHPIHAQTDTYRLIDSGELGKELQLFNLDE